MYINSMLYTRKGDGGSTALFGSKKRISKNTNIIEALGELDELNSLLGVCRAKSKLNKKIAAIVEDIQQNLFIIQAELAGAPKKISKEKIKKMEKTINEIEKKLPKITSFLIPGATENGAYLDFARAVSRRTERRVLTASRKNLPSKESRIYLNRLSSLLYALARYTAVISRKKEKKPTYI